MGGRAGERAPGVSPSVCSAAFAHFRCSEDSVPTSFTFSFGEESFTFPYGVVLICFVLFIFG